MSTRKKAWDAATYAATLMVPLAGKVGLVLSAGKKSVVWSARKDGVIATVASRCQGQKREQLVESN